MKRSNLEVGLRVILKKAPELRVAEFIGQEFTISAVERAEFAGELTVQIDGPCLAWCNHRDLKLVKEEAPISGALFVVTGCTTLGHCFDVGTVVRCANPPMGAGGNCRYEDKDGELQFVSPSDLKSLSLADIQAALDK